MPHPTKEQLREIAGVLNRYYPNKWAITGSVALVLQAQVSRVSSGIFPGDLDLIIESDQFDMAAMDIAKKLNATLSECPGPRSVHVVITIGELSIDLLDPNAERGDMSNITRMNLNGVMINVVGLSTLKNQLLRRIDDPFGNKKEQASEDIEVADSVREARSQVNL